MSCALAYREGPESSSVCGDSHHAYSPKDPTVDWGDGHVREGSLSQSLTGCGALPRLGSRCPTWESPGPTDPWTRVSQEPTAATAQGLANLWGQQPTWGGAHCPGRELCVLLASRLLAPHLRQPRRPLLPAPLPLHPPSVQSPRALSMIAQPVARILICIPRRPARPGHQPTFGPDTGRPAPAPGRRLRVVLELLFPEHLTSRLPACGGSPGTPLRKGTKVSDSLGPRLQERKFAPQERGLSVSSSALAETS